MLPVNLNWLDLIIALALLISLIQGIRAGLIRSAFNIAGLFAGTALAMKFYAPAGDLVLSFLDLPRIAANVFSFIIIFSLTTLVVHLIGSAVHSLTGFSLVKLADRLGGSTIGLVIGIFLVGLILITFTSFPVYADFPEHVDQSYMAPSIIDLTTLIYDELSSRLPFELPRIATYPESLGSYISSISTYAADHQGVNFKTLDQAPCFACGAPVDFLGYLDNGKGSISPKFLCSECGRTSDGCQTYEGYHAMYSLCPVELSKQGYRFDCGIWTNFRYVKPEGPCTECGADYK